MNPDTLIIRGVLNPLRLAHGIAVGAGTTALVFFFAWSGMASPILGAAAIVGYPYTLFLLVSTVMHAFDRLVLDDAGLHRRGKTLAWAQITSIQKHSKEYRNRLGMKFLETRIFIKEADKPDWWFDSRWFLPESFALLEAALGRRHPISADYTVVPPP